MCAKNQFFSFPKKQKWKKKMHEEKKTFFHDTDWSIFFSPSSLLQTYWLSSYFNFDVILINEQKQKYPSPVPIVQFPFPKKRINNVQKKWCEKNTYFSFIFHITWLTKYKTRVQHKFIVLILVVVVLSSKSKKEREREKEKWCFFLSRFYQNDEQVINDDDHFDQIWLPFFLSFSISVYDSQNSGIDLWQKK